MPDTRSRKGRVAPCGPTPDATTNASSRPPERSSPVKVAGASMEAIARRGRGRCRARSTATSPGGSTWSRPSTAPTSTTWSTWHSRQWSELEPWPAVVAFLEAFVRYAQGKRTFLNELREAFDKNPDLRVDMMERVRQAHGSSSSAARRKRGSSATDMSGSDLMQLVGPMCTNATLSEEQSRTAAGHDPRRSAQRVVVQLRRRRAAQPQTIARRVLAEEGAQAAGGRPAAIETPFLMGPGLRSSSPTPAVAAWHRAAGQDSREPPR